MKSLFALLLVAVILISADAHRVGMFGRVLTVIEQPNPKTEAYIAPNGKPAIVSVPGATIVWYSDLYDAKHKKVVGLNTGSCIDSFKNHSTCTQTLALKKGSIVVSGDTDNSLPSYSNAIVGGTGIYSTAAGHMDSVMYTVKGQVLYRKTLYIKF